MLGNHRVRTAQIALVIALVVAGASNRAWAQFKVFAKVIANPTETKTPLIFDVNNEASDNISPNIVIAQDQKRGFVCYTGSGDVVEFSLLTGEILNRFATGGHPFFATQLPDNHTLAISSVLDNRVFIVDMDSPSRFVATYTFKNAQFGFGSIVTLSPDGTTGFISSTGTAEIIKFRMSDGHELGRITGPTSDPRQRLRLPTQITITPNGATLIVVDADPGTPEVAFYDTTSFAKKGSLKNPSPTTQSVAFTIFNKAVLAPDGKTGIIASRGSNNVSYRELVFLFDATNGTILKTGETGPGPTWTGLTPDGKKWVIVNMFSLTVIPTDDFESMVEYQAPAGESLGSANVAFSADSKYGFYSTTGTTAIIKDEVLQVDLETGSFLERLQVGDSPDTLNDQPSGIAITNDGKIIATLEFVSDNIDLMTPVTLVAGGKFFCSPDTFTGISVLNLSSKEIQITMYAMQDFGEPNAETGVRNPVVYILSPNQQISYTVEELFLFDDDNAPNGSRSGWIAIYSDVPEVTGYVTIGKKDGTSLNGLPLDRNSQRMHDWILPTVNRNGDATVEFSTLNDTFYSAAYDISRVSHDGTIIDSQPNQSAGGNYRVVQQMPDLFPRDHLDTEGYMWMTSPEGVFSNELYNNGISTEIIKGIDRTKFVGVTKIYAPQFATVSGWKTILNLINANENDANVTVTFHASDGSILWQFQKTFVKGEQLRDDLVNLYNNQPSGITTIVADPTFLDTAGWLEVESTQDRIIGLVTFNPSDDRFAASYELSGTPLSNFLFPIVSQNESYQTGVALLNNDSAPAVVTLELWGMDCALISTETLILEPKSRTSVYLDSLFPGMNPLLMGNLRVRSDKGIYGFGIVNDSGFNFVMAMPLIQMF
jgi:hypothetical protein